MRGHDPVGKLHAAFEQRERGMPYRGAQFYFVGAIRDEIGTVWTCEGSRLGHQHGNARLALQCAADQLATGTWKDDLPPLVKQP
jgi:hypothetical protein